MTRRLLTCVLISLCLVTTGSAEDVAAFYRGKLIRFIVGSAPGGAYDLFARIVARHIVHYIPGNPTSIVQNQMGTGSIPLANQLYAIGPRDGTVIGVPLNALPTAPMLMGGAQFDARKLIWLGSTNRDAYVGFIWHTVPVTSVTELTHRKLVVGSVAAGATMSDFPMLLHELLGYKFKIVRGYNGTPAINLAMERGEIEGNFGVGWSSLKAIAQDWIDTGKIRVIVQYGFTRDPQLPDVPSVLEFAKSDADRLAMRLMFARTEYARPYFLPLGVPPERVEALRRAFDAAMKDPDLIADAAKLQLEVSPMTGEQVQDIVGQVASTPPEIVHRVRAALDAPDEK